MTERPMCKNCIYYVTGKVCLKIVHICAYRLYTIDEIKYAVKTATADTVDEDDYCEHFRNAYEHKTTM